MRRDGRTQVMGRNGALAALISGMTPRERRVLHEAVKRRILREQDEDEARFSAIREDIPQNFEARLGVSINASGGQTRLNFIASTAEAARKLTIQFVYVDGTSLMVGNKYPDVFYDEKTKNIQSNTTNLLKENDALFSRIFGSRGLLGIGKFIEKYDVDKTVRAFVNEQAPYALETFFPADSAPAPAPSAPAPSAPAPSAPAPSAPAPSAPAPSGGGDAADPSIWSAFEEGSIGLSSIGASSGTSADSSSSGAISSNASDDDADSDESASKVYKPGATLTSGGKEIFKRTQAGWVATLRLTAEQVASLVTPDIKDEILNDLRELNRGEEYKLKKGILRDPDIAGKRDYIVFEREGDLYRDPTVLTDAEMVELNNALRFDFADNDTGTQETAASDASSSYAVGDAIVKIGPGLFASATISVKDDGSGKYRGFKDIFGDDSPVEEKLQRAVEEYKKKGGVEKKFTQITFSLKDAMDRSLMKEFVRFLGFGKIKFQAVDDDKTFTASVKVGGKEIRKVLERMVKEGRAKKLR